MRWICDAPVEYTYIVDAPGTSSTIRLRPNADRGEDRTDYARSAGRTAREPMRTDMKIDRSDDVVGRGNVSALGAGAIRLTFGWSVSTNPPYTMSPSLPAVTRTR